MSPPSKPWRCAHRTRTRHVPYGLLLCSAVAMASAHSGCATTQPAAGSVCNQDTLAQSCPHVETDEAQNATWAAGIAHLEEDPDCEYIAGEDPIGHSDVDSTRRDAACVDKDTVADPVKTLMQDIADSEGDIALSQDDVCWHQQRRITQPNSAEERYLGPGYVEIACTTLWASYDEAHQSTTLSPLMQLAAVGWDLSPCRAMDRAHAYLRAAQDAIAPVIEALWDLGAADAAVDLAKRPLNKKDRHLHVERIAHLIDQTGELSPGPLAAQPLAFTRPRAALLDWYVADQSRSCAFNFIWSVPMGYVDGYMASCDFNNMARQLQCRRDADNHLFELVPTIQHLQTARTVGASTDARISPTLQSRSHQ